MPKRPEGTEYTTSAKFQKFLKEAIDEQEMKKVQFAEAAGVSTSVIIRATLYQIVPSVKTLIKLADYLQVPIMYMLGETDDASFSPAREPSTFFERLERLTEENGEKYSALSHTMSFAPNAVYEWIRTNSIPSLDYLIELANHFDVSIDYLLGRTDDRH
ncbi:MAG: transcriptional regulator [Clostridiales bacterium]|nr:transcriptional regulator [Clostridiales bacterium]